MLSRRAFVKRIGLAAIAAQAASGEIVSADLRLAPKDNRLAHWDSLTWEVKD